MQILAYIYIFSLHVNEVDFHFCLLHPVLRLYSIHVFKKNCYLPLENLEKQRHVRPRWWIWTECDNAFWDVRLEKHGLAANHLRFCGHNIHVTFK